MGLETGTTIAQLVSSNPTGGDPTNQGDDHLQLIKSVLKSQFPGSGGDGYSKPIVTNENELNFSQGVTSSIQDQLDALAVEISSQKTQLNAPIGTKMVFYQTSAPTGWTIDSSNDNAMMRVVSSSGGGSGGSDSPISFSHSHTTGNHTLTINEIPSHNHSYTTTFAPASGFASGAGGSTQTQNTGSTGGGASHNHGNTNSVSYSPKYVDMIVATKD